MTHSPFCTCPALGRGFTVAALVVFALVAAACETTQSNELSYSRADDEAFEAGANLPPSARTLHAMSRLMAAQGQDDRCAFVLARIIRDYPTFAPAYSDMAEVHLRQHRIESAISVLADGVRAVPNDPVLLNNLGMCSLLKQDYATALVYFDSAARAAPGDSRYVANRATALGMLGRYDESLAAYRQVVPLGEAHYNLAVLCRARLDMERADAETRRAVQLGFKEATASPEPAAPETQKP